MEDFINGYTTDQIEKPKRNTDKIKYEADNYFTDVIKGQIMGQISEFMAIYPGSIPIPTRQNNIKVAACAFKKLTRHDPSTFNISNIGGIALKCGKDSGIICIDFDVDERRDITEIIERYNMKETLWETTPSGGMHFYYEYEPLKNKTHSEISIDVRSDGGYSVCGLTCGYRFSNFGTSIKKMAPGLLDFFISHDFGYSKKNEKTVRLTKQIKSYTNSNLKYFVNEIIFRQIKDKLNLIDPDSYESWSIATHQLADLVENLANNSKQYKDRLIEGWCEWSKRSEKHNLDDFKNFFTVVQDYTFENFCHDCPELLSMTMEYEPLKDLTDDIETVTNDNIKYVSDIVEFTKKAKKAENVFIRARMGSGKSKYCIDECKRLYESDDGMRIISIVARISLIPQQIKLFGDIGIELIPYSKGSNALNDSRNVITTIDSLHKLDVKKWGDLSRTILFFDEAESNLTHYALSSTMNRKRRRTFKILRDIITDANKCLFVDADLSAITINFIDSLAKRSGIVLNHIRRPYEGKSAYNYNSYKNITAKILEDVKNGGRPVIACDCRDTAKELYHLVKTETGAPVYLYTKTDGDIKTLENVTKEWAGKVIIYSPKIVYGIDYNPEQPEKVFLISTNAMRSSNALNLSQMTMRNRNISEVHYYFEQKPRNLKYKKYSDISKFYDNILDDSYCCDDYDKLYELNSIGLRQINEEDKGATLEEYKRDAEIFNELFKRLRFNDNIFESNPQHHYEEVCLISNGFNIIHDYGEAEKKGKSKEMKEQMYREDLEKLQNIINGLEVDINTHRHLIDRLDFYNYLPKDEIIEKHADLIINDYMHAAFNNFKMLHNTADELQFKKIRGISEDYQISQCNNNVHKLLLLKEIEKETGYDFRNIETLTEHRDISEELEKKIFKLTRIQFGKSNHLRYVNLVNNLCGVQLIKSILDKGKRNRFLEISDDHKYFNVVRNLGAVKRIIPMRIDKKDEHDKQYNAKPLKYNEKLKYYQFYNTISEIEEREKLTDKKYASMDYKMAKMMKNL